MRRPGPVQRIFTVVYLTAATAFALTGLACLLFTLALFAQWAAEAALR